MLTEKQKAILDFINHFIETHQFPPSVREIGKQFGIYPATVQDHISALERKGYLQKKRFQSRALSVSAPSRPGGVPIVGRVAAGLPLLAHENIEEVVHFPPQWAPTGAFLLKVQGESMIDAHILDGDYVLVQPQASAESGEIVVALLGEEATVKRFMRSKDAIVLKAENPKFKSIPVPQDDTESFRIVGKVVGVLRIMKEGASK
jgi:repressor LexA